MDKVTLKVNKRSEFGRKVKKLRRAGVLPGNIYGTGFKSVAVSVDGKAFSGVLEKAGATGVVDLELDSEKSAIPVLIHNVQVDPVEDSHIHVDFLKIDLKKKVTADVPLEIIGESPAEKQGLGTLVQYIDEVEVEALPTDLPENIQVDASSLVDVDHAILIKDLKYDKDKVEVKIDLEEIVAKIEVQKEEPVEVAQVPETPTEGEAVPTEGSETPAEGESKEGTPQTEDK
ncbi:hypothetical protein A3A76_02130 [Candidatus Woesebacteria bacterium RIFCSPLOWO2_01_FULL_39_23]|uniref:Large ribosomal subunit protein bL25 n=1 Tax=Candidatus Woesebacteria bacterium RIFCSPHIGHO2_01_FULL_40_22 TaxID=1802499 RepID=A0A1F7YFU3_9BACT|nr:MAG: hypothetical protein A2141_03280 [Candidatus Woesebacteria bacterium RBG_16_40_11]OGM26197.1 MAG: hypothetical protein A2628_02560 [Candidatus Woesebacteria bacterium RIFCSPHIGHO2_01_FULL_40_22]OGM37984.1 MAG: hypothetical protein A3E41_03640 [Candidatus Woesebacteria bacterium RIFCSPHIGHO2_12_FULL_38_9]OGM62356.1 MAG: hypothetical protein A3A76_02130 [Candidatus Woesebacteria bacterium RIFCSPLOWO2_01_FULL_39_23]